MKKIPKIRHLLLKIVLFVSFFALTGLGNILPVKGVTQWVSKLPFMGDARKTVIFGNYAYITSSNGLHILDITNPNSPTMKGYIDISYAQAVAISGNYAYVSMTETTPTTKYYIKTVNIINPLKPEIVGGIEIIDSVYDLYIVADKLYAAAYTAGLRVINIVDPLSPKETGYWDSPGFARGVAVSGNIAVIGDNNAIETVDINSLQQLGTIQAVTAMDVVIKGDYAYVADNAPQAQGGGLRIIKITNPQSLSLEKLVPSKSSAGNIDLGGNYAYLSNNSLSLGSNGVQIIDITVPVLSQEVGFKSVWGRSAGVSYNNNIAYLAEGFGGFACVNVSNPSDPTLLSQLPQATLVTSISYGSPLLFVTARNQSLFSIYDIANPLVPSHISTIMLDNPTAAIYNSHNDIDYVYISDQTKLKVFNIQNPSQPSLKASIDLPNYVNGFAFRQNSLYAASGTTGIVRIDITNRENPILKETTPTLGDAKSIDINDTMLGLANKTSIALYSFDAEGKLGILGSLTMTNSIDIKLRNGYAYVADLPSGVGLQIIEIKDHPNSPTLKGSILPKGGASTSGVVIIGDYAFVANASNNSIYNGMQIINIKNVDHPVEVSFLQSPGMMTSKIFTLGNYAYLSDNKYLVDLADISDYVSDELTVTKFQKVNGYENITSVSKGDIIEYSLKIENPTTSTMTNLNLSDIIPAGTNYVEGSASDNGYLNSGKIIWPVITSFAEDTVKTMFFKVKVN